MNVARFSLVVAFCLIATAQADLTLVQKVEGAGGINEITIKLKGDKSRVEISPELTTIIDKKNGETLQLMNSKKKVVRISNEKLKAIAEMAAKYSKDTATATGKLVPTGNKNTINGYDVEEYVRESPSMKETYWIAPKYPDSAAIVKQLQSIAPSAWNEIAKGVLDFRDFPGLPLRTIIKTDHREVTSTFISIKQDSLSDAEFSVPKDFEELKIPNLQDVFSEKSSAPSKP